MEGPIARSEKLVDLFNRERLDPGATEIVAVAIISEQTVADMVDVSMGREVKQAEFLAVKIVPQFQPHLIPAGAQFTPSTRFVSREFQPGESLDARYVNRRLAEMLADIVDDLDGCTALALIGLSPALGETRFAVVTKRGPGGAPSVDASPESREVTFRGAASSPDGRRDADASDRSADVGSEWRVEPAAGSELTELSDDGQLSEETMTGFNVYRIVRPAHVQLDRDDGVELHGNLACACGYSAPLDAEIGFGGFFEGRSQRQISCPQCNAVNAIVGTTSESRVGPRRFWLLVSPTIGQPGWSVRSGTASGLPELQIDVLRQARTDWRTA